MRDWYKKLNITTLSESNIKWSTWILFVFAFIDASFFPLPVSTFFLVLMLFDSSRSFRYVLFTTLGTLTGAFAGYLAGYLMLVHSGAESSPFLQFMFNHIPGFTEGSYHKLQALFSGSGFWILFGASFTPIPFGLFSLAAGAFQINILSFIIATIVSQLLKFLLLAYIAIKVGPEIKMIFKVNLKPILVIASVCIAIAFLVTRAV